MEPERLSQIPTRATEESAGNDRAEPIEVTAHVRAHTIAGHRARLKTASTEPAQSDAVPKAWPDPNTLPWPDVAVILDTETTTDLSQRLLFGVYRVHVRGRQLYEEGVFLDDELSEPEKKIISAYAKQHSLPVKTRREFLHRVLFYRVQRAHHRTAGGVRHMRGAIVGFNLLFDLSRLALGAKPTERTIMLRGGWTFDTLDYDKKDGPGIAQDVYTPKVQMRQLASGALISFTKPRNGKAGKADCSDTVPEGSTDNAEVEGYVFRGRFLDCKTLADALTDSDLSLEGACRRFGLPYRSARVPFGAVSEELIDHCREDVVATSKLYFALLDEYRKWGIPCAAR